MKAESSPNPLPAQSFAVEPVHLRIAKLCRKAILSGEFPAEGRFPSERELAERYDVSRATANKVISTLVAEGLLNLRKGLGAFVVKRRTLFASLDGMESFTAHAQRQGLVPHTEALSFERIVSSALEEKVREGLGIAPNRLEDVFYFQRLRLADGVPMILEHRWVRESLAPDLDEKNVGDSFYHLLEEKFDLQMTGEQHSISAVILDDTASDLFLLTQPTAALCVEGTGYIQGDTPLWYQQLFYRGDRYELYNETRGPAASNVALRLFDERASA